MNGEMLASSQRAQLRRARIRVEMLCDATKTAAGTREVPMGPVLHSMLVQWRERCPRRRGELVHVFPAPCGKAFRYFNFRSRIWLPGLRRAEVPYVSPHSARHAFISTLQAQGFEVGLVAKIAGHTPSVSLAYYTQAVRSGGEAVAALEQAFGA
jgi:integrase